MKPILVFVLAAFVAVACSVGTRKDLVTGMSISYNGFHVGEAYLVNSENQVAKSNVVSLNDKIAIVVTDVGNYEEKDGRVFPVLDMVATDKNGSVVLQGKDIIGSEEGYAPEGAAELRGTITVGNPLKSGETYHVKMMVTDKLKPENVITVEVDLVVK